MQFLLLPPPLDSSPGQTPPAPPPDLAQQPLACQSKLMKSVRAFCRKAAESPKETTKAGNEHSFLVWGVAIISFHCALQLHQGEENPSWTNFRAWKLLHLLFPPTPSHPDSAQCLFKGMIMPLHKLFLNTTFRIKCQFAGSLATGSLVINEATYLFKIYDC